MEAPTDETLLREFLRGDPAGFELLVRRHSPELYQFVVRLTGDSMAAEDVVQETFLKVHGAGDSFDPTRRFKPWLFTIAANKARDHIRRRVRRREVPFDAQIRHDAEGTQRYIHLLTGDSTPPDEELLLDEKRRIVRDVIEQMPGKLGETLILAYYHRFAYKDIGEVVGIPLGTVKSRLHAAVAWFAEHYKQAVADQMKHKMS